MSKPFIPRPCIRRVDLPTGEKFAIELSGGHVLATFVREEAARIYAKRSKLNREHKVWFEYEPNKFTVLIESKQQMDAIEPVELVNSED